MPNVVIYFREGKNLDQKRALAKNMTAAIVESFGVSPGDVSIQMIEQKSEHVARGGVLKVDQK
jgi:4-oxalocrotonate tautomerase